MALAVPQHPPRARQDLGANLDLGLPTAPLLTTWRLLPDGTAQIRLAGELDLATVAALDQVVGECLACQPRELDIDVASLAFCDVLGIHAFLRARRSALAASAAFRLSRPRGQLVRVAVAAGVADLITPDPLR
ncbi:STAS domain-containing protein [Kitasatospora sp. NPDC059571]|uniref:STAS domain-containing protein n=1 Tax=Kitasatospora sp. NPDC059571 TaxID=3346871 RepID=UPI00368910F3